MKYLSGIHALNLPCNLNTCGDWHCSGLQWERLHLYESEKSLWGDYGIEQQRKIPFLSENETFNIANHIRALLDLIYESNFAAAQGMKEDFICTDEYNKEIFDKIVLLKTFSHWDKVNNFMKAEYGNEWDNYLHTCK